MLAGKIIEFDKKVHAGKGYFIAEELLNSGKALDKFYAICKAQGGYTEPHLAPYCHVVLSHTCGKVIEINNRRLSRVAKLAGAPIAKMAGVKLLVKLNEHVENKQPLYIIYAESTGELDYAISFAEIFNNIIIIKAE